MWAGRANLKCSGRGSRLLEEPWTARRWRERLLEKWKVPRRATQRQDMIPYVDTAPAGVGTD